MALTGAGGLSRYRLDLSVGSTNTMRQRLDERRRITNTDAILQLRKIAIQFTN